MTSVRVTGQEQLTRVVASLTEHADGRSLKNKMRRDFRNAGSNITKEQRADLAAGLPHRGGLASAVSGAGTFSVRTGLAGKSVSVDIVDSWKGHDMRAIEAGLIRHPVWGRWLRGQVPQRTRPGLLSRPVALNRRSLEVAIVRSLDELAEEIAKET